MIDDELLADKAISFYKVMITCLKGSNCVIILTLDKDGELQADAIPKPSEETLKRIYKGI